MPSNMSDTYATPPPPPHEGHTGSITLDKQHRQSAKALIARAHERGEEIGHRAAGDPLLLAVDDVLVAATHSCRLDVGHIAAGQWFTDRQTTVLAALYDISHNLGYDVLLSDSNRIRSRLTRSFK
jgi:hypothetical protein